MFHKAYIAVIAEDGVVEKVASEPTGEPLRAEGNIGTLSYSVISAGFENDGGMLSSMVINGTEYSKNMRGLNVVVLLDDRVIDSVAFDTYGESQAIAKR